jgi:hypothetical protein
LVYTSFAKWQNFFKFPGYFAGKIRNNLATVFTEQRKAEACYSTPALLYIVYVKLSSSPVDPDLDFIRIHWGLRA